jgi:hypothetical protein
MSKKKVLWLGGGVLALLLLVGLVSVTFASAQEPTPVQEPTPAPGPGAPFGGPGGDRGRGGRGGFFGGGPGNQWTTFDAAAEALGLTPEAFFSELHAGKTLEEIAEAQGVDIQAVHDAMNAARTEAMKQAIEQAVADGTMTQEQADWILEGIEQGFAPLGRGFAPPMGPGLGHGGRGWDRGPCPESE